MYATASYEELVDICYADQRLYNFIVMSGKPPENIEHGTLLMMVTSFYHVQGK